MQGHQNWCKLSCCEQGLDWIVTLIPGKGVGIIALDDIPSLSRIIVEASREINIANSFDLMPFGGSFQEKLANNGIVGKSGKNHLYPWIARLNHSCDANASICIDDTFKVAILYAKKDIKRGQEITINYQPLNLHGNQTPEDTRLVLFNKWGIVCSKDCKCRDDKIFESIKEARSLDKQLLNLLNPGDNKKSLDAINKILRLSDLIGTSWMARLDFCFKGFNIAIMKWETIDQAFHFLDVCLSVYEAILNPDSAEAKRVKGFLMNYSFHQNFLILE